MYLYFTRLFQFTPLREGRPEAFRAAMAEQYVNSRPSARGDDAAAARAGTVYYFNSRPSARGDMSFEMALFAALLFQFTPLREGRRQGLRTVQRLTYFNSRPSARGDNSA